mmetsp:Transcript_30598/g.68622  ORF Transcript_30598/g.68622 Transcript_30598/m.68622 type:complete len:253 (+) Transcript_30598:310-1068(+)
MDPAHGVVLRGVPVDRPDVSTRGRPVVGLAPHGQRVRPGAGPARHLPLRQVRLQRQALRLLRLRARGLPHAPGAPPHGVTPRARRLGLAFGGEVGLHVMAHTRLPQGVESVHGLSCPHGSRGAGDVGQRLRPANHPHAFGGVQCDLRHRGHHVRPRGPWGHPGIHRLVRRGRDGRHQLLSDGLLQLHHNLDGWLRRLLPKHGPQPNFHHLRPRRRGHVFRDCEQPDLRAPRRRGLGEGSICAQEKRERRGGL